MAVKKVTKKKNKIPKSVQDTIPYLGVYKNGIIEISEGYYTKMYQLEDVDFKTASDEISDTIFDTFGKLLNSFDDKTSIQFTIDNKRINRKEFEQEILTKMRGDALDELREENNQILSDKLKEGRSNMQHLKYLTVCSEAESIDDAIGTFSRLDAAISSTIKPITNAETRPMNLTERMSILYDMMNRDGTLFYQKAKINGKEAETFNLDAIHKRGLSSKDVIAPMSMEFQSRYIRLGRRYARILQLAEPLPTQLSTDMLADLTELPLDMVTTLNVQPIESTKARKVVQRQLTKAKKDVAEAQKAATKSGYSTELIPESTKEAYEEADILMNEMTHGDQKMFLVSLLVMVYADSKEELDKNTNAIKTAVDKHVCKFKIMGGQQEIGFKDTLPLCNMGLGVPMLLTTENTCVFLPYTTREVMQKDGFYYGLNAVSKNMIIYNRNSAVNPCGIILGMSGTGKSFSAKREMVNVALNTDDVIYVLDPQGEYSPLINLLGGQEIEISTGSGTYLNPLDMDLSYGDSEDPVAVKSNYICSICEIALGGVYGLSPIQKTIINRCVRIIYRDYMKHMQQLRANPDTAHITMDKEASPTLQDLYECLMAQDEEEARYIATALELYTDGSFDTFAHRTNVKTESRIVSWNIKRMGEAMREFGLTVCLNTLWNQTIENFNAGKRTWIYLDEFHLLTKHDSSADFVKRLYKMIRKWGGVPTGITQNVEDLLLNEKARAIINNCAFVYMLSQSPNDRAELQAIYNIPDNQMQFITNGGAGQGLIYNGKSIIPFIDQFPEDTKLYRAMTTKPEDFEVNM